MAAASPDWFSAAASLAGGLGLFLLGMALMSDGLKLAAGPALERILTAATRTRAHALGSGMLVTALVQSSSAVTVATIGFVNAGLLPLSGALWVLFGANVGTTMTGWIVALVGLKFKIDALALPLVGAGVLLRLTGAGTRRGALGDAVAGFGLLFLGIALLQQAFAGMAAQVALPQGTGVLAVLAQLMVGLLMTVLMQSSSASIAIALTAAQGGLISAQGAAAVVIGANLGTTVTALLAVIGATANARCAAWAHVIFNALTGIVALALLPWVVGAIAQARAALGLSAEPAAQLALFHTVFNLLGVALMWPLGERLAHWLAQRFRSQEEDAGRPRHLDDTALAVPALALDALSREIERLGGMALDAALAALRGQPIRTEALDRLEAAIAAFVTRMHRGAMSEATSGRLAQELWRLRHWQALVERARMATEAGRAPRLPPALAQAREAFESALAAWLGALQAVGGGAGDELTESVREREVEAAYLALKNEWMDHAAQGTVGLDVMEAGLNHASAMRRAVQQARAARSPRPHVAAQAGHRAGTSV